MEHLSFQPLRLCSHRELQPVLCQCREGKRGCSAQRGPSEAAAAPGGSGVSGTWGGTGTPAGLGSRDAPSRLMPLPSFQKIPGTQINEENAEILGRLVCDLGGEYIRSSGGSLLKDLSQCGSFLPDQEEAIRDVISSGNTTFGYGFFSWTSPNCSLNQTHCPTKT